MFWDNFSVLCNLIGKKPSVVAADLGLSNSITTKWKNGAVPNGDILAKMSEYFNTTTDFLLFGKVPAELAELHEYHSDHPSDSPVSKKYNAVCKIVDSLAGKFKANALLSAIGLPYEHPAPISDAQLHYLAFYMYDAPAETDIFEDEKLLAYSKEEIEDHLHTADPEYATFADLQTSYPEVDQWNKNFDRLFFESLYKKIDPRCLNEFSRIISEFRPYAQGEIMSLFKAAVYEYKKADADEKQRILNEKIAERKGSVS